MRRRPAMTLLLLATMTGAAPAWGQPGTEANDPRDMLRQLAIQQTTEPTDAFDLGLGLAVELETVSPERTEAFETLADVVTTLQELLPEPIDAADLARPDVDTQLAATRGYVRAKAMLNDDDTLGGLAQLEQAAALDPDSATILSALGLARVELGLTDSARKVLVRTVQLGERSPDVLYTLADIWLGEGDLDAALPLLAEAYTQRNAGIDPALPPVISARLGRALLQDGRVRAGATALAESLQYPRRLGATTAYLEAFGNWVRQRDLLQTQAAEAFWAVGDVTQAAALFAQDRDSGSWSPQDPLARLVSARAAAGQPAAAALAVLDTLAALDSPATDQHLQILRALANETTLRDVLSRTLEQLLAKARAERQPASLQSGLMLAWSATQKPSEARTRLREWAAEPEATTRVLEAWLVSEAQRSDAGDLAKRAATVVEQRSEAAESIAALLLQISPEPDAVAAALQRAGRNAPAARSLSIQLALAAGNPHAVEPVEFSPNAEPTTPLTIHEAELLAARGAWGDFATAAIQLRASDRWSTLHEARLLAAQQRFAQAMAVLASIKPQTQASLDLAADLHELLGDRDTAIAARTAAVDLDPSSESLHRALLGVLTNGPQDPENLSAAIRRLRNALPYSSLMRELFVQNLIQNGLNQQATQRVAELQRDGTPLRHLLPLHLALQRAKISQEPADAADRVAWRDQLARFHAASPTLLPLTRELVTQLVIAEEHEAALAVAEQTRDARLGDPEAARLVEGLLASVLDRGPEAIASVRARLDQPTLGLTLLLERARLRLDESPETQAEILEELSTQLGFLPQSTPAQRLELARVAGMALEDSLATGNQAHVSRGLELMSELQDRGQTFTPQVHELRLRGVALLGDLDRIVRACREAAEEHPQIATTAWVFTAQALNEAGQAAQAAQVLTEGLVAGGAPLNNDLFSALIDLLGRDLPAASTKVMIDRLAEAELTLAGVEAAQTRFSMPEGAVPPGASLERTQAELAYLVSSYAMGAGQPVVGDTLLELAAAYDETHPWVANDFGYRLAEEGDELARAERLLTIAVAALPNRGSVLDSLGWLRYKLGQLENDGEIDGAIQLLVRASQQDDGKENATIFLHLGDALWRAGQADDAQGAWRQALVLGQRDKQQALRSRANPAAMSSIDAELQDTLARLNAIDRGEPPPVAPSPGLDGP